MEWYFDFISPYAYLQFKRLEALGLQRELRLTPILFAGVLNHWGQRGPAEIPPKRVFTYRHVSWLARSLGVPFKMPEGHPFNPLKLLRLAIYGEVHWSLVARLFDFVWRDGFIPDNAAAFSRLIAGLELPDAGEGMNRPEVKAALRSNTERAICRRVRRSNHRHRLASVLGSGCHGHGIAVSTRQVRVCRRRSHHRVAAGRRGSPCALTRPLGTQTGR